MMLGISLGLTAPRGGPRTNLLTNSAFLGAVSGTPGTAPTGWTNPTTGGSGTVAAAPTGGNSLRVVATANRQIYRQDFAAAANATYTLSFLADITTAANIGEFILFATLPTGATAIFRRNGVTQAQTVSAATGTGVLLETVLTMGSTAGTVQCRFGVGCGGTATGDATFWAPQLEVGSARTTYQAT